MGKVSNVTPTAAFAGTGDTTKGVALRGLTVSDPYNAGGDAGDCGQAG